MYAQVEGLNQLSAFSDDCPCKSSDDSSLVKGMKAKVHSQMWDHVANKHLSSADMSGHLKKAPNASTGSDKADAIIAKAQAKADKADEKFESEARIKAEKDLEKKEQELQKVKEEAEKKVDEAKKETEKAVKEKEKDKSEGDGETDKCGQPKSTLSSVSQDIKELRSAIEKAINKQEEDEKANAAKKMIEQAQEEAKTAKKD